MAAYEAYSIRNCQCTRIVAWDPLPSPSTNFRDGPPTPRFVFSMHQVLLVVVVALVVVFEVEVRRSQLRSRRSMHLASHRGRDSTSDLLLTVNASSEALDLLEDRYARLLKALSAVSSEGLAAALHTEAAAALQTSNLDAASMISDASTRVSQRVRSFSSDVQTAKADRQAKRAANQLGAGFGAGAPHVAAGGGYDDITQQRIISEVEAEYPSEAVEEHPGPPYTPPPDAFAELPAGEQNRKRADAVVDSFRHSWAGYTRFAFGCDELQPRSRSCKNWNEQPGPRNGIGLTVLDAITTMHVMGLHKEEEEALQYIKTHLTFQRDVEGSTFESTIRMVGALLSIYELNGEREGDRRLLDLAVDLTSRLMWAYNTSTGLPHSTVGFASRRHFNQQWIGGSAVLSEFGTAQLELRTLSYHTQDPTYDIKATHVMDIIAAKCPDDMLCPCYLNMHTATWTTDHVSLGALGDSFYEYVLKQYLLTGKTEQRYRDMFVRLVQGIIDKLLFRSYPSHWAYVAEYRRGEYYHKMDHLACFVGGMLALGSAEVTGFKKAALLELAGELTETCVKMYTRQKSGVSPEFVEFPGQQDFVNGPGYYILRPETMESLFYMWRFTKDRKWRDYGWSIFRAIDRWCRVEGGGYSGLKEVNVKQPIKDNLMQSFWLAETLKYAYLLFAEDEALNLGEWVLNTEAHPLKRRKRDPIDVWRTYEAQHGSPAFVPPDVPGITERTETEAMRLFRKKHQGPVVAEQDGYGEELVDGPVDDEGSPWDPIHGKAGLPRHAGSGFSTQYIEDWALPSGQRVERRRSV